MNAKITKLKELINQHPDFVFLSGAGVSTASGIPDFRGKNGIYRKNPHVEYLLSHDALVNHPQQFFKFYYAQMLLDNIKPNIVHNKLADYEKQQKMGWIITQNIDGLHSLAGSQQVIELHGSIHRNYCMACYKQYDLEHIKKLTPIPKCVCGGMIRPDVVLYGESLVNDVINKCYQVLKQTNLLIVAGTQLSVSTAAGVVNMFSGKHLVILNDTPTPYDHLATLVIREELTNIFKHL